MKSSTLRLLTGVALIPSIILADSLPAALLIAVILVMLALREGRKFRPIPNIILLFSVSLAHTLQPHGLYLFSIFSHPVTLGSLAIGAQKALLLISFIYLSHFMMAKKPTIPGKLGSLLSLQFYYFDRLITEWKSIPHKRPIIGVIDALLIRLSEEEIGEDSQQASEPAAKASKKGWAENITILLIVYAILLAASPLGQLFNQAASV